MSRILLVALCSSLLLGGCLSNKSTNNTKIGVSVSPRSASVSIGGTQQFTATVTGASNSAVTWTVSGEGCGSDDCGTVSSSGLYSAPDAPPVPNVIIITATCQADNSQSATANLTANTSTNSKLMGSYAFLFSGYETPGGDAVAIAGSISLDGQGGVTAGKVDINRPSGVSLANVGSGSAYLLGADDRGRLVLNVDTTPPSQLTFRIAMDGQTPSHNGRLIAFDAADTPSGLLGSGVVAQQDTASFSTAAFNGDFALGLSGILGDSAADRAGAVGRFTLNGTGGVISGGLMDFNLGGTVYSSSPATGTYSIATDGRGLATLNVAAPFNQQLHFSFYVVSRAEALFLETDAQGASTADLSGSLLAQSGQPFSNSSLRNGGAGIFNLTGQSGSGAVVSLGRIVTDGAGQVTEGTLDQNSAGTISNVSLTTTGPYAIASTGRGTLTLTFHTAETFVIYMVKGDSGSMLDQWSAFLLQTTPGSTQVGTGFVEAQSSSPPITTASITGTFHAGTLSPAVCGCAGISGVADFNGRAGSFAGVRDRRETSGDSRVFPHEDWSGTYSIADSTGRGTLQIASPSSEQAVIYSVSPSKFLMVIVEATVTAPVVTVFEK